MMHFKTFAAAFALLVALAAGGAYAEDVSVNINQADAAELADALVGIGLARAEAIVAYRAEFGPFEDVYELVNVRGVGERTVNLNEARIRLK
jgi:competence protein ComEA